MNHIVPCCDLLSSPTNIKAISVRSDQMKLLCRDDYAELLYYKETTAWRISDLRMAIQYITAADPLYQYVSQSVTFEDYENAQILLYLILNEKDETSSLAQALAICHRVLQDTHSATTGSQASEGSFFNCTNL